MIIDVTSTKSFTINLGRQGENDITEIVFDYSGLAEEYGEGTLSCIVQRKKTDDPYPTVLTAEDHMATWNVSNVDTAYSGTGKIQLSYVVDEQIKKSIIFKTKVEPSIIPISEEPPEPIQNYLDQMIEIGTQVHADAETVSGLVDEIEETAETAETNITQTASTATSNINSTASTATSNINSTAQSAVQTINQKEEQVLQDLSSLITFSDDGDGNITISIGGGSNGN